MQKYLLRSMYKININAHCSGMTLLEVLIAILLFAVFSGVFLTVTEMLGVLIPIGKPPLTADSCNGSALELACINIAFDELIPFIEKNDDPLLDNCYANPKAINSSISAAWPDDYRVCIYPYPDLKNSSSPQDPKPGIFLLQAEPTEQAFWRRPVQRVFCNPYHLCVNP